MSSVKDESTKGWTRLYTIVVAALLVQITFFVWLTKNFN